MKKVSAIFSLLPLSRISHLLQVFSVAAVTAFILGCAGGGASGSPPGNTFSGNTSVTVLATGTANDQLSQFDIQFMSFTLTSQTGDTAQLLEVPTNTEFIHLNGNAEPLVTASVPQGVYTSATAVIGSSSFACVAQVPSAHSLYISTYAYGSTPSAQVAVNLPAPITITGTAAVLSLNMLVSKSASYPACVQTGITTYSINPTFNLTPITLSSQPTNPENGKLTGLNGLITSVDSTARSFEMAAADGLSCVPPTGAVCPPGTSNGPTWQVGANGNTVFQGVANFAALAAGMPVDMDATIQPDGSLLATRIAVADTNVSNLSVFSGPVLNAVSAEPVAGFFGREQEGYLFGMGAAIGGPGPFSFDSATFQTSGQFSNLQSLPFPASFSGSNIFAGQNVSFSTNAANYSQGPIYIPATTVTLMPQTINGTITAIGNEGGFDTYTVSLAPYDLFPNLAVQPGQTTVLTDPSNIVVYADSNTQMLNTNPPAVGSIMRFNGLVFNDHGTLKMDAAWANDGVAE